MHTFMPAQGNTQIHGGSTQILWLITPKLFTASNPTSHNWGWLTTGAMFREILATLEK